MELALRDALTGLPNRHAWQKELPLRLEAQAVVCVALLDVDFFKRINDQEGHHVGDRVLREIATSLRAHLRADDFVARLGGDEFGVVLAGVGEKNAEAIIERVRVSVSHHLAEKALPAPTMSAGFVCCPPLQPVDSRAAFAAAAAALRQAKRRHRDCCVAYSADCEQREPRSAS
jgi:diguanylate cyclase (GGDEF)-like protein